MSTMTAEEAAAALEHLRAWASSPEGQKQIKDSKDEAKRVIDQMKRDQRIDPARLREPVTI